MKYKAIIFDCDGTLLNTVSDLTNAVNYALEKLGFPQQTDEETLKMVGNGIKVLVFRALPENKKNFTDEALSYFKEYYGTHFADKTMPYDGVCDLLKSLKKSGYKIALVSNKNARYLELLVKKFFSEDLDFWIGETDGLLPKPAPDMVNKALEFLQISAEEAVYVGDSPVDVSTAKNSELDGIFVSWGFCTEEQLFSCGAKTVISAPQELLKMV